MRLYRTFLFFLIVAIASPIFAASKLEIARDQYISGEYDKALDNFQSAYASRPSNQTRLWIVKCCIKTSQWTLAQDALLKLLEEEPENTQSLELLAYIFSQTGKHTQAVNIHKKIVRNNPSSTAYLLALAKSQTAADQKDQAIETLEFANRISGTLSIEATRLLADLYINKDMPRQAALCYQKIITSGKSAELEDYFRLAYTYYQTAEFNSAKEVFQEIIKTDPNHTRSLQFLAHIAEKQDHPELARKYYITAADSDKTSAQPCVNLAQLELNLKNYASAVQYFAKAINRGDRSENTHYNHTVSCLLSNQPQLARSAITNALKDYPTSEKLNSLLDRIIKDTNENQKTATD